MNPTISINSEIKTATPSDGLVAGSCSENFSISSLLIVEKGYRNRINSIILSTPINIHFFAKGGQGHAVL